MLAPSGDQYAVAAGDYRAVVTQGGGALRVLTHAGRPLLDGFEEDQMAPGGRGQLLVPWPNRIRDGRYTVDGTTLQLALTEPSRHNASHGLARWVSWTLVGHTDTAVTLGHRLMAQTGYPWLLDLTVRYELSDEGLTVTQSATNRSPSAAPYASGAHPYLSVGPGPVDSWELTLPAATHVLTDERMLPVERRDVGGTAYDFRSPRPIGDTVLDHAFTDLDRDPDGRARVTVRDREQGRGVELWVDAHHGWLQLFTADGVPGTARRSLAVEPMTAGADAFNTGDDVVMLAPAGDPGETHAVSWGIGALG